MAMPPEALQAMMQSQQGAQQGNMPEGGMAMTPPGQPMGPQGPMMPGGPPPMMGQPPGGAGIYGEEQDPTELYIDSAMEDANLAKKFRNKEDENGNILEQMGADIFAAVEADEKSRQDWMKQNEQWLKLALLIRETKTFPWPKASNVKYPLIATAAMQFSARAYPALVPNDGKIVKTRVVAKDPTDEYAKKALNVAIHMSYQVSCQIPNWEEEMDKLLMTMAISGVCFKKTWHDSLCKIHRSEIIYPEDLIINYYAKSLETAYRKTEVLYFTKNELFTKVNNDEEFLDCKFDEMQPSTEEAMPTQQPIAIDLTPPEVDKSTPFKFWACHTYWDLDDDGYEEPYIVTIHWATKKVVRITARWDSNGVTKNEKGKVIYVKPVEYFTDFPFIPNADGSIYACGFGMLMGPLNEAVNTLVNQLIDAGTLSTLSGGFIGKNLRIKMGQLKIQPGEWKVVNASGEEMQKSFYPIPTKEPSAILYQLMQFLVTSGNQLASIAEIFVGKMPGQNTPATTTQETIQQGMAVFTAIYKRVYRSLHKEFLKIFRLNKITPGMAEEESKYVGQISQSDYIGTEHYIIPGADPSGDSATVRQSKMEKVGQLLSLGTIDPMAFTMRMMEGLEIPNPQELAAKPQPPAPDPKIQTEQVKQQTMQMGAQIKQGEAQQKMQIKEAEAQIKSAQRQEDLQFQEQMNALKLQGEAHSTRMDSVAKAQEQQHAATMHALERAMTALKNMEDRQHQRSMNQEKIATQKALTQQKAKAKPSGNK